MDKTLIIIAGIATVAFLIVSIMAAFEASRRRRDAIERLNFRPKKQLMVGAEKHCFQLLNDIFGQKFYIIPQVSLSALLSRRAGRRNPYEAYNFIENGVVDFVFCNKQTLRPVCAVKLDNNPKHHYEPGEDPKDMEKFFRSAHLPFVRITNPKKLDRNTVIEEFSRVIYETSILPPFKSRTRSSKTTSSDQS